MNKENSELINFIESKGFIRDIEDNVWYTKDYRKRVVPKCFNKHSYHLYYDGGGFNNPIRFNTIDELKKINN